MSAETILEVVRLLDEHRRIPLYRLAKMLHTDPDALRAMTEMLSHRGPDGGNTWLGRRAPPTTVAPDRVARALVGPLPNP